MRSVRAQLSICNSELVTGDLGVDAPEETHTVGRGNHRVLFVGLDVTGHLDCQKLNVHKIPCLRIMGRKRSADLWG